MECVTIRALPPPLAAVYQLPSSYEMKPKKKQVFNIFEVFSMVSKVIFDTSCGLKVDSKTV